MTAHAAVAIDDDLSAGEAGVAVGAADFEAAGGVDVDGDGGVPPLAQDGLDDVLDDLLLELVLAIVPGGVVLGREDDGVDADGLVVLILDGHLALGVGAEARNLVRAADVGLALDELVRELDGEGHELRGVLAGEAEHHALVAGAFAVDAHGDVVGLLVDGDHDAGAVGVEAHVAGGVADLADGLADEVGDADVGVGGDFAGDDDQAGAAEGFAGDAAEWVIGDHRVEDRVGDLVGHFVGVTHGDRFGGEQLRARHLNLYSSQPYLRGCLGCADRRVPGPAVVKDGNDRPNLHTNFARGFHRATQDYQYSGADAWDKGACDEGSGAGLGVLSRRGGGAGFAAVWL